MLNNKNLLFKRNIELSSGQYIRIACEMDSQGNPIQYSMACNLKDAIDPFDEAVSTTGGYWLTKDTIRWYILEHSSDNAGGFTVANFLFLTPCYVALQHEYSEEEVNNRVAVLGNLAMDDEQVREFFTIADQYNYELDVTAAMNNDAFAGFTKLVNASVDSPSAFNNFWAIE